ncbi:MAG TPA: HAMP domain-containing sensor histidine kinase [Longimicrobium sp.]|uniref:sensor histidine kinase n=1 Tax=Longimicrobium sp. TaxID=2029185 RepID=UPI002ED862FD
MTTLRRKPFERRLRRALLLFSVLPSLLVMGVGTFMLSRSVRLNDAVGAWERVGRSGAELVQRAEQSGDTALARAAAVHRAELEESITNARRWEYLLRRGLGLIPLAGLAAGALLAVLAMRASRRIGRRLSAPVEELADWAGMIGQGQPLPAPHGRSTSDEFAVLRNALRRMASELETSRERALEAERARTWIGMARRVAHELKNPLTPIRFALRTLERAAPPREDAREALEVLAAESARLEELARTFAQLGRMPEGPPSEIDLQEMLDYLRRTHLPAELPSSMEAADGTPRVQGHHDALSRAFANLLLNAGEAVQGRPGARVDVVIGTVDGEVQVRVLDSGPGIAPEIVERIWEPDFTTRARGTGLGLALVRQTVQSHGGRVWARTRAEGGAEFGVALPAAAVQNDAEPALSAGARAFR